MANEKSIKNLRPLDTIDKDLAKKYRQKGQAAGVKVKKQKKTLKEMFEYGLEVFTKKALNDPNISAEQKAVLTETNILVLETLKTAINSKVRHETRLKASDMIMERIHGKPKQEIESKNDTNITIGWEK